MAKAKTHGYAITRKPLPEGAQGQQRAVYDAIAAGATDAAAVREAVSKMIAFKGRSAQTISQNAAWHVGRLRRDGFVKGGR